MRLPDLDVTVALVVFGIFAAMVGAAVGYTYEARLVPLVVGVPALLLAAWQLRQAFVRRPSEAPPPAVGGRYPGSDTDAEADRRSNEALAVLWLLVFTTIVIIGGLVVGGTIGVMACQRIWLRETWRTTALGGAMAIFVLHVCLGRALGFELFEGLVAEWIRR